MAGPNVSFIQRFHCNWNLEVQVSTGYGLNLLHCISVSCLDTVLIITVK